MIEFCKKLLLLLMVFVLMISMVTTIAYAETAPTTEKKDKCSVAIDSKEKKVAKLKVTWSANGGKIGSKKTVSTSLTKGSKLKKFANTPKRSGYTFNGWYTKKDRGNKITINTKPTKSLTYYAQWKKRSSNSLNADEKKLLGTWADSTTISNTIRTYTFKDDGSFQYIYTYPGFNPRVVSGNYKVSGGKITFAILVYTKSGMKEYYTPTVVAEYVCQFEKNFEKETLKINGLDYPDRKDLPIADYWHRFYKRNT